MAIDKSIKSILIIGAGPIVIGQACEFDYSGSQAAKALKSEGYKVIGITLKLYNDTKETAQSKQCCAGQDILDAKRVADKLKIEHKITLFFKKKLHF